MTNKKLMDVFSVIVKTSRDTGLDIVSNYKNKLDIPKNPDDEQKALIELIEQLDANQIEKLQKGVKYCIELSLFKLISTMANGVSKYSFDLYIEEDGERETLIGNGVDHELSMEYWDWIR